MLLPKPLRPVFDSLEKYLAPHNTVIVGVSGGPDSVFLLHALHRFTHKNLLTIIVAHINHGIRRKEADRDEHFVKKLAQQLCLGYHVKRVKLQGSGLEEKGRKVRRAFFELLARKYKAAAILTAHTLNDQLETVIFNMVRGAYISGMGGMHKKEGLYLKPLLGVEKKELLAYLKKNKLSFCYDAMNDDESYSRVLIRKKIIPLMEKINPSVARTVSKNAELFQKGKNT